MKREQRNPIRQRSGFIIGLLLLFFSGLIAQLGNLTLMQQQQFRNEAEEQRIRQVPIFAPRGVIYDRNMESLVLNRPAPSAYISYPFYKDLALIERLASILKMDRDEIQAMVADKMKRNEYYEPIHLKSDISSAQYATILERQNELPGVEVQLKPIRVYPLKDSAAHMLGYVGEINVEELAAGKSKGYLGGELIGRTGLEAFYEDQLRGKPGIREIEINNRFQPLGESQTLKPQPGNSLVLTIDAQLQRVAERALDWGMWRIRNTVIGDGPWPNAKAGAVVVMAVKTGEILAMASRPAYDPNLFARGITPAEYAQLQDPVLTPEVNRAIQTAYQPGSTWKMMTAAAALENGVISPQETVFCGGVYDKAGNPKDWTPLGHGYVNTVTALQGSCDIYFYEMGYRMGVDKLVAKAQEFGFGAPTGIDMGAENPGRLPDTKTREELWSKELNDPWGVGHTVSASIGQIVQVTPLQLARYVASLGNGGKLMKPYLVQKVLDSDGTLIREIEPQTVGKVVMQPAHLKAILDGMAAVDSPQGGTSDYAIYPLPGISTGGKTGTAEYPPWDDYGFFVSLAPFHDPEIAVAVVVEQAGHGGSTASIVRSIQAEYFQVNLPDGDPAYIPAEFPLDLAGLRRKYRVVGSGE